MRSLSSTAGTRSAPRVLSVSAFPEALLAGLERRFLETAEPRDLTLVFAAGQGDGKGQGLDRLGRDGLLRRVVGGHWGLIPSVGKLALENRIEAYNLPQGCISHLYRDIAAGKPGLLSRVGLGTFVDPRQDGGKVNTVTTEDLVRLIEIDGQEWLLYRAFPIQVALDPRHDRRPGRQHLHGARGAHPGQPGHGHGGQELRRSGDRPGRADRRGQQPAGARGPGSRAFWSTPWWWPIRSGTGRPTPCRYSPAFAHELRVPLESLEPMPLDARKIIARRAAMELPANGVVNLGIGMPEGVASVANEEKILRYITLTAEPGVIGGVPASGLNFGAAVNTDAMIDQNQQFDFYDGGGLDLAVLGMAECDAEGNVNVSRFGGKLTGAGGFINISQNARAVVFTGTFTAGGLQVAIEDGRLRIVQEGRARKFVEAVGQVTFSGGYAAARGKTVLYVTERCVFRLTSQGLELIEIAPGIDLERDILAHMAFRPLVGEPELMDGRIFRPEPMGLDENLFQLGLDRRISLDADRDTLFLNFEGMRVRTEHDVDEIRSAVEAPRGHHRSSGGGGGQLRQLPHRRGPDRSLRRDGQPRGAATTPTSPGTRRARSCASSSAVPWRRWASSPICSSGRR